MGNDHRRRERERSLEKARAKNTASGRNEYMLREIEALKKSPVLMRLESSIRAGIEKDIKRLEKAIFFTGVNKTAKEKLKLIKERIEKRR